MPANFAERKIKILADLSAPDEQYQDLSPKGSVDAGIRALIAELNAQPNFVTTSSCAGRIAAYLEGSKGAKGGGRWLFTSHDPIEVPTTPGSVYTLLGLSQSEVAAPPPNARFVHLKFEPMPNGISFKPRLAYRMIFCWTLTIVRILHILTANLPAAQQVASAALSAGFRESGINSIVDHAANQPATPMAAVRSSGLAFDCIIGYSSAETEGGGEGSGDAIVPMVSEAYLKTLLGVANQRFATNNERRERFRKALLGP